MDADLFASLCGAFLFLVLIMRSTPAVLDDTKAHLQNIRAAKSKTILRLCCALERAEQKLRQAGSDGRVVQKHA